MNTKHICLDAHGVRDDQCMLVPAAGSLFTEREWSAIGEAMSYKGTKRVAWRRGGCPFGSDGYIFQQAKILALNLHGMPSQFVMLFNADQRQLFWSITNKLSEIAPNHPMAVEFNAELRKRFGSKK